MKQLTPCDCCADTITGKPHGIVRTVDSTHYGNKIDSVYNTIIISLRKLKIRTYKIPLDNDGHLDLKESLIKAKAIGFSRIFLETGAVLTTSFLSKKLIDDFKLFISNKNLGKTGVVVLRNISEHF